MRSFDLKQDTYSTIINAIGTAVEGIDDVSSIAIMMNTLLGQDLRKKMLNEFRNECEEIILALI